MQFTSFIFCVLNAWQKNACIFLKLVFIFFHTLKRWKSCSLNCNIDENSCHMQLQINYNYKCKSCLDLICSRSDPFNDFCRKFVFCTNTILFA